MRNLFFFILIDPLKNAVLIDSLWMWTSDGPSVPSLFQPLTPDHVETHNPAMSTTAKLLMKALKCSVYGGSQGELVYTINKRTSLLLPVHLPDADPHPMLPSNPPRVPLWNVWPKVDGWAVHLFRLEQDFLPHRNRTPFVHCSKEEQWRSPNQR